VEINIRKLESVLGNHQGEIKCSTMHITCIILLIMAKTLPSLLPRLGRILEGFGTNLRLARLRRKYSAETVAQRAGITRRTLSKIEQGDPSVAFGAYARVMQVLRLENDLAQLAVDDVLGRKLQDANITLKRRAPKRVLVKETEDLPTVEPRNE
jgi:transcriptional regulator with XRE-family HTH domain